MLFRGKDGKLIEVSRFNYIRDDRYYARIASLYDIKVYNQYTDVTAILTYYSTKK
jgi:hypothetical protein